MRINDREIDLGPCCCCESRIGVQNILMLDFKALIAGTGWGCAVCGLPGNGALAVVCDACLEAYQQGKANLKWACHGYPVGQQRINIEALTEPFAHDDELHALAEDHAA